jgi:tetratricopeptide (TPR) repeat protein
MPEVGLCWLFLRLARADPGTALVFTSIFLWVFAFRGGCGSSSHLVCLARCHHPMVKATDRRCRAHCARMRQKLRIFVVLLCSCLRLSAQTGSVAVPSAEEVRQFADEQRWQDIALLLGPLRSRSAELNFYYGTALARLERWPEAESAFQAGLRLAPHDPRFPAELAGVAFKQKHYPQATRRLRQALKLAPQDAYANDFLGTIYFLQGNLDASLKYWNRVGKPQVVELRADPSNQVSPALLDRAFAFSPASTLQWREFRATDARIRFLGIFPRYHFDLRAREDDKFDVWFRSQERNGFGSTKGEALFLLLRGLPFLSVNPEYYNLRHEAINLASMFRWDPQKRRLLAQFSSPFQHSAKYRYQVAADLRNENWALRNSDAAPSPPLATLNLRREVLGFSLASPASGQWHWSAGAEISHRDFRSVVPGPVLTPGLLAKGYQLKQLAELGATLWRVPERRFAANAEVSSQAARLWSQPEESSEKLQGSLGWHWFPRAEGDDYEMQQQFRFGKTFGTVPFDELYMVGLERDNNLPLRAHIGTRDGRKGSAPLGRNYFLATWETDKNVYGNGIVNLKMGPFLDTGKITDPSATLGSHKWLWDTGAQIKLRVFGTGVTFSYGKDLRSGNNAFYLTTPR